MQADHRPTVPSEPFIFLINCPKNHEPMSLPSSSNLPAEQAAGSLKQPVERKVERPVERHLGLFAKHWTVGEVKTRLAASIGAEPACEIYQAMLFHLIEKLSGVGQARTVVFSPLDSQAAFRTAVPDTWTLAPQSDGDLGKRMETFFESTFDESSALASDRDAESRSPSLTGSQLATACKMTVVIGADCPQVDAAMIEDVFQRLRRAEVVLGPSVDGGYYLIAMRERCVPIFNEIEWSTPDVLRQTIAKLEEQQVVFELLPPLRDIDEAADLGLFFDELTRQRSDRGLSKTELRLWSAIDQHRSR